MHLYLESKHNFLSNSTSQIFLRKFGDKIDRDAYKYISSDVFWNELQEKKVALLYYKRNSFFPVINYFNSKCIHWIICFVVLEASSLWNVLRQKAIKYCVK